MSDVIPPRVDPALELENTHKALRLAMERITQLEEDLRLLRRALGEDR